MYVHCDVYWRKREYTQTSQWTHREKEKKAKIAAGNPSSWIFGIERRMWLCIVICRPPLTSLHMRQQKVTKVVDQNTSLSLEEGPSFLSRDRSIGIVGPARLAELSYRVNIGVVGRYSGTPYGYIVPGTPTIRRLQSRTGPSHPAPWTYHRFKKKKKKRKKGVLPFFTRTRIIYVTYEVLPAHKHRFHIRCLPSWDQPA